MMGTRSATHRPALLFLLIAWTALVAVPAPVSAQDPGGPPISVETMTAYARAYIAVAAVRDSVQLQLAAPKNKTTEAQAELRGRLRARVGEIIREHAMTEDEYRRITYRLSTDPELRKAFEEIMAALTKKDGAEGGDGLGER